MNKKITRKKLLMDVLSIQTTSGNEFDMIAYIHKFCQENVPQAKVVVKDSNIYVTKGKSEAYPCIVAHTDTVHNIHKYYKVFDDDGCLFAFNAQTGKQVGVGGDDKVGIWIALEMLLSQDTIKCAFFHSEEVGCIGSRAADMEWFKDVGYCFQADRRGDTDFVNSISGKLYSKAFKKAIAPVLKEYGYKETSGAITDVGQLAENGVGVCVANMSCGYYEPHSDEEIVEFDAANKCLNMVEKLVAELGNNKYEFQFTTRYANYGGYGASRWGDFAGAGRNYWYGDYGSSQNEVIIDEDSGEPTCYYCGSNDLQNSEYGDDFKYCMDCVSDIYCGDGIGEVSDPNQQSLEFSEVEGNGLTSGDRELDEWNKSFGVEDVDYNDISDSYDGSMKHKSIVNEYLTNYQKNK